MDNVIFANRLKQLRKEKGITQKQLADELKISLSSVIHYENAHRSPVSGIITLMQQYFDVSKEYLLGETDERRPAQKWDDLELTQAVWDNISILFGSVEQAVRGVSAEEQKLVFDVLVELRHALKLQNRAMRQITLSLFHDFTPTILCWPERSLSGATIKADFTGNMASSHQQKESSSPEENTYYITSGFYEPMSAGLGEEAGDGPGENFMLIKPPPLGTSYIAPVKGDSMEPTFHDGDRLFVHACVGIEIGQIGVFLMDGKQWVKELGDGVLLSHNPAYPPIPMTEDIRCQGLILGVCDDSYFV